MITSFIQCSSSAKYTYRRKIVFQAKNNNTQNVYIPGNTSVHFTYRYLIYTCKLENNMQMPVHKHIHIHADCNN